MKLIIDLESGNAAFAGDAAPETARILRDRANRLESGDAEPDGNLRDVNGNTVGHYAFDNTEADAAEDGDDA